MKEGGMCDGASPYSSPILEATLEVYYPLLLPGVCISHIWNFRSAPGYVDEYRIFLSLLPFVCQAAGLFARIKGRKQKQKEVQNKRQIWLAA